MKRLQSPFSAGFLLAAATVLALAVGTVGAARADTTIGAQSVTTYLTPSNTSVTVPVAITRGATDAVRAFSVTIQLSPELQLSTPISPSNPMGSIAQGTFFDGYGTAFEVFDRGGGAYQVDCAIEGSSCGPVSTSGTLFTVGVTSSVSGTCGGTVAVLTSSLSPRLRDCNNGVLAAVAGTAGTVPIDNDPPTISAMPGDLTVYSGPGRSTCDAVASWMEPTASDACSGSVSLVADHLSGSVFPLGTTLVTYTATDARGNVARASFHVTALDNTPPTIAAPADVGVSNEVGHCYATGVPLGTPVTSDNCGVATVTSNAPSTFEVGATTVIWTVTDVHGNTATATQTVTVNDTEKPTITAPAAIVVGNDAGQCYATGVSLGTATTADNCGVASVTNDAPAHIPVGTPTTVIWTVTDVHGNTATATQTVTVNDTERPTITAPAAVVVGNDAGQCYATIASLGTPTTADNCAVSTVASDAGSSHFPVGTTTVTWTVTDVHGNTATATQSVTVNDTEAPIVALTAPVGGETWVSGMTQNITWSPASDNCGVASVDLSYSTDGGSTYTNVIAAGVPNTGSYVWTIPGTVCLTARVRITARDLAGNVTSASSPSNFTITGVSKIGDLAAHRVVAGNGSGGTSRIQLTWTPTLAGTSVEIWRSGFGRYPWYASGSPAGSPPSPPTGYPPAGWTLAQTVSGTGSVYDHPTARDYCYYVAYVVAGEVRSDPSSMSSGVLDYFLGDVTDGVTEGQGDNQVSTGDISLLGAHYGTTLVQNSPLGYLDVGPTSNGWVDGLPQADGTIEFEDLVIFAINYGQASAPQAAARPAAGAASAASSDALLLERPDRVSMGESVTARLTLSGSGELRALSTKLGWDPAVVEPVGHVAGDWLQSQDGVAFSARPGTVDAAVLSGGGMKGSGELATVTFRVVSAGDPKIVIASVDGRDLGNHPVSVSQSERALEPRPTATGLAPTQPNPFRDQTTIAFSLAQRCGVELAVFSVDGRRVRTLVGEVREAGEYRQAWDGRDDQGRAAPAGVYYARLLAGGHRFTHTVVYLR